MDDPQATLDLWDYRRQVEGIYRRVRESDPGEDNWDHWRSARDELFAHHPQSALNVQQRQRFRGLRYFPYDPHWRFVAEVQAVPPDEVVLEHNATGTTPFRRFGVVALEHDGAPFELTLFWLETYGGGVFLPFRDATNGAQTYGGGRYLLDTVKGADLGRDGTTVTVDFNFAYHPSCTYDPAWSCPLSPPENRLDVAVTAGERLEP